MPIVAKVPHEITQIFGPAGTDKFVDFLNSTYLLQKEEIVTLVSDRFDKNLTQQIGSVRMEIADVRMEIADVRTEIADLRSEMRTEIADLRAEMRTEITEVRSEIANLRSETKADIANLRSEMKADFAAVHREISAQTKWILAGLAAAVTLYPVVSRLAVRLLP